MSASPMTACASRFEVLASVALALALQAATAQDPGDARMSREAGATLVVFNSRDPDSRSLAEYYAQRRRIPSDQVVALDCPTDEEISRKDFADTIESPLRAMFDLKGWWTLRESSGTASAPEVTGSRIRFVALMRGIPLKIKTTIQPPEPGKPAPPRPNGGDPVGGHDEASVDSELAALGAFQEERFGVVPNPYYRRFTPIMDSVMLAAQLLVTRLDAPTEDTVRRMIDDGIKAEQSGLHGWAYIDRRSIPESGYKDGDEWLQAAAAECWNQGIPVILDNNPAILPAGFPVTDAALYYGWYAWAAEGAMGAPHFRPGAVAVHIHSFSAATLRDPAKHWAAPLLTRGVAATIGNVYEPYLDLTPHLDVFNERLLQGFTFAESAYMSLKVLSWMNTVVGDPLYRPFAATQAGNFDRDSDPGAQPWTALQKELRKSARSGPMQTLYLARFARENPTGLNYEALGLLQSFYDQPREALSSLEAAGAVYRNPAESFRTVVERIRILQTTGNKKAAIQLIDRTLQRAQPPERAQLLEALRNEIEPPPPAPSVGPKKL
ncbi:MAG: TIGR03790 family protein [Chthoniobacterales bacterium]|nr:TIGR03790 family protein [Chthoniobacterales bacterium]